MKRIEYRVAYIDRWGDCCHEERGTAKEMRTLFETLRDLPVAESLGSQIVAYVLQRYVWHITDAGTIYEVADSFDTITVDSHGAVDALEAGGWS